MAVPGLNTAFDNLLTMTINRWMSANLTDVYTSHHPLIARMFERGNVVKGGNGYKYIEPLYYPVTTGPSVQGVTEAFNELAAATETGGITAAAYTPAQFGMLVAVRNYDIDAQGSETEKLNLVENVMKISITKYMEFWQTSLWAAEATAGSGGEANGVLGSLRTYINGGGSSTNDGGATPGRSAPSGNGGTFTAVGTTPLTKVGGIERNQAGGAYFTPNIYNPSSAEAPSAKMLNVLYSAAVRMDDKPDLIIMGQNLYNFFMNIPQLQQRFDNGDSTLAKYGFDAFRWRGADVVFDDGCPDGTNVHQIFCLNTKYLKLRYNTMKPVFELVREPRKLIRNWQSSQTLQITSGHLGRVHSRHAKVADPA